MFKPVRPLTRGAFSANKCCIHYILCNLVATKEISKRAFSDSRSLEVHEYIKQLTMWML